MPIQVEQAELEAARVALVETLGWDEVVDAASISSTFNGINRVANVTGVKLDTVFDRDGLTEDS